MKKRRVSVARRKLRRDIKNPLAGDFIKYLAEIILNADDSYKRIEEKTDDDSPKKIVIRLDRDKKEVTVTDYAEGMDEKDLEAKFGVYGADQAGGETYIHVRGLFGQGASDVLFSAAMSDRKARIESIKDGRYHTCDFLFNDEKLIRIASPETDIEAVKNAYGIEKNGTVVTFGVPSEVALPRKKNLKEKIERFHMFRYILCDEKREVTLDDDGDTYLLSSERFTFEDKTPLFKNKTITFNYEDDLIEGTLDLYINPHKDADRTHVIIKDERDAVYDNTLFNLERYPGANLISGELTLPGLYGILKRKLEDKEHPLQILTDSRDGFDERNDFTQTMFSVVAPVIEKAIEEHNTKRKRDTLPLEKIRRYKDALESINDYYLTRTPRDITPQKDKDKPPTDGLSFIRDEITVTLGRRYTIPLLINANIIPDHAEITLSPKDSRHYRLSTARIHFDKETADSEGLVKKRITLEALRRTGRRARLEAAWEGKKASILIDVIKEPAEYPQDGLAFIPPTAHAQTEKNHVMTLYYDMAVLGPEASIEVTISDIEDKTEEIRTYTTDPDDRVHGDIGMIEVEIDTGDDPTTYHLTAVSGTLKATARLRTEKQKKTDTKSILSSIRLTFEDAFWQTVHRESDGVLFINAAHPVNWTILGDIGSGRSERPFFTPAQDKYVFELIATEVARTLAKEEFARREITHPDDVIDFIQREKTNLYRVLKEELLNEE